MSNLPTEDIVSHESASQPYDNGLSLFAIHLVINLTVERQDSIVAMAKARPEKQ